MTVSISAQTRGAVSMENVAVSMVTMGRTAVNHIVNTCSLVTMFSVLMEGSALTRKDGSTAAVSRGSLEHCVSKKSFQILVWGLVVMAMASVQGLMVGKNQSVTVTVVTMAGSVNNSEAHPK